MAKRGTKPFTYDTYAGPMSSWDWFHAARSAREIAEIRGSRGDDATATVTEKATGKTWIITPETDLVAIAERDGL